VRELHPPRVRGARFAVAALAAGVVATALEATLTTAEARVFGSAPYEPAAMAARLARRLGVRLPPERARIAGAAMRASYGPAWGLPAGLLARRLPWPAAAALLASALFSFELTALPVTGATPPVREWRRRFVVLDALNVLAYAALATGAAARIPAAPIRSRSGGQVARVELARLLEGV
jgi:hypothetical protein